TRPPYYIPLTLSGGRQNLRRHALCEDAPSRCSRRSTRLCIRKLSRPAWQSERRGEAQPLELASHTAVPKSCRVADPSECGLRLEGRQTSRAARRDTNPCPLEVAWPRDDRSLRRLLPSACRRSLSDRSSA